MKERNEKGENGKKGKGMTRKGEGKEIVDTKSQKMERRGRVRVKARKEDICGKARK